MGSVATMLDSVRILHPAERLTLDLSGVNFLGAAGLGAIVSIRNDLIGIGGELIIVGVHPRHAWLFLLVGLAALMQADPP
jgi:anti-anti-sigma factor